MAADHENELMLERKLIKHLQILGYERITLKNVDDVKDNFRQQVNIHNIEELQGKELSDKEFERLYSMITGKGVFASSKILREKQCIEREDGTKVYIELFNKRNWCKNTYQVSNQVTSVTGETETRYDVTLFINGIPVVQIELKARGKELKEAVNQIERYRRTSYKELYKFIQIYVVSNGVNTKYFANTDSEINFGYTFYWTDEENNRISNLNDFTTRFLEKCYMSKIIARYMVINETDKQLMVLRPYQIYAVEALVHQATETSNNGYIWHTTGSGKTLTSFKASQILSNEPSIKQVFFLVDRKDLDTQTFDEFNKFEPDCVDFTNSTYRLVKNTEDSTKPLIITTIQKMANAINNPRYAQLMNKYKDEKVVFIIDECHRSQFGEMHKVIQNYFNKAQYFGFTGTPRFPQNKSQDGRTTADIFGKCLHKYLLKDAISDKNVLGFSVDYYKTIDSNLDNVLYDEEVEGINTEEAYAADERINNIVDGILVMHPLKTNDMQYTSIFATASIPQLVKYYNCFKSKKTDLKITAIFTYGPNEEYEGKDELSFQSLERIIKDYNEMFDTNYSLATFDSYFRDVSKRVKNAEIDILIVVNMFLTGFDSKTLNTLYVDKCLKHHDLIQAFSRTNRVHKTGKTQGNIVSFRTSKKAVDEAIRIFSDTSDPDKVLLKPYEYYKEKFIESVNSLKEIAPSIESIDNIKSEEEQKKFILTFREVTRILVKLKIFREFKFTNEEVNLSNQEYLDYRSKYLDLVTKKDKRVVTILDDIDFELELMYTDRINVDYIMNLIRSIDMKDQMQKEKDIQDILRKLENADNKELRLKSDLIRQFLNTIMPDLNENDSIEENYYNFLDSERRKTIEEEARKHNIDIDILNDVISEYEYSGVLDTGMIKENINKPLIEKVKITKSIKEFIINLIEKFK